MAMAVLIVALVGLISISITRGDGSADVPDTEMASIGGMSGDELEQFFEEYTEMRRADSGDNVLIVKAGELPGDYGAVKVVAAPYERYLLLYGSEAEKQVAMELLRNDGLKPIENIKFHVIDEDDGVAFGAQSNDYMSWGIERMGLDRVLEDINSKQLAGGIVAIIDTGVDEALFREKFPDKNLVTHSVLGDEEETMVDMVGHGTHIAGTIAEGTSDATTILVVKVGNVGDALMLDDVIAGVQYAAAYGVDTMNISLGSYIEVDEDDEDAKEMAEEAIDWLSTIFEDINSYGVVSVASAGNENVDEPLYPAALSSVISVASVDQNNTKSDFSNYGETIDFAAPGGAIKSINGLMSGTSMAAPHLTAAVAALKVFGALDEMQIDADLARTLLRQVATDLGDEGWDQYYGWGIVDFDGATFCMGGALCDENGMYVDRGRLARYADTEYLINGSNLTVSADKACMVLISADNGETFTRLVANASELGVGARDFNIGSNRAATFYVLYKGDTDLNGQVNIVDTLRTARSSLTTPTVNLTGAEAYAADVDANGVVNIIDVLKMARAQLTHGAVELEW